MYIILDLQNNFYLEEFENEDKDLLIEDFFEKLKRDRTEDFINFPNEELTNSSYEEIYEYVENNYSFDDLMDLHQYAIIDIFNTRDEPLLEKTETLDLIKDFMLKNHIEYLDENGYNKIIYDELYTDGDDVLLDIALDLCPIFKKLADKSYEKINKYLLDKGLSFEYINYFFVDMENEYLCVNVRVFDNIDNLNIKLL